MLDEIPKILSKEITDKYDVVSNTFIREDKGVVAEEREVEIGDIHSVDFQPQVKLKQWDNETNFSVRLIDDEPGVPQIKTEGNKIKFIKSKREAHFYDIKNGYEFEVLLKKKPKTNKVQMSIETKGLSFYYQSELTQEEKDEGAKRPENVIGSYAVYHESKAGDYSQMGLKNYRAGKAFHIYRPKIIDSAGKEVWGILNVDEKKKLLTVEIPQKFLDNAVYPVIVDPTFGYETAGTSGTFDLSTLRTRKGIPSSNGTATSISCSCSNNEASQHNLEFALYNNDSSYNQDTDGGIISASASKDWRTLSFSTQPSVVNGTAYKVVVWSDSSEVKMYYDSGGVSGDSQYLIGPPTFPNWPSNPSFNNSSNKYSIYCTYTAGGATETIQKSLKYCIEGTPSAITKSLKYCIERTPSAVTKSLAYETVNDVVIQKSLKYTVPSTPSAVQKSLKYCIITIPTATTKSLQYAIEITPSAITKSLGYKTTFIPTTTQKALQYEILGDIAITKELIYSILTIPSAITKGLIYKVVAEIDEIRELNYEVTVANPITKSLKYCIVVEETPITKSLGYNITQTPTAITKSLTYEILSDIAIQKSLKYTVEDTPAAIEKGLIYDVEYTGPINVQKSLKYDILSGTYSKRTGDYSQANNYSKRDDYSLLP